MKEKELEVIKSNQKTSLNRWIDYLSSPDADYPMWAKYWAFTSMLKMGKYEKTPHCPKCEKALDKKNNFCKNCKQEISDDDIIEKARFQKRNESTTNFFPLLNSRALAKTISAMGSLLEEKDRIKREKQKPKNERDKELLKLQIDNESKKLEKDEFIKLLSSENFAKLYAQFLLEIPEYSTEGLKNIEGEWVPYYQGSDPGKLVEDIKDYPLEWCTADYDTAKSQLQGGDFYVYYSHNKDGEAKIPRVAIRMVGKGKKAKIAEPPRGIGPNQNLDPDIHPKLDEKLDEFGEEGERYKDRIEHMEKLKNIWKKNQNEEELKEEELKFIYEIDQKIEGFGYERDTRIDEILKSRDIKKDLSILFGCNSDQIATNEEEFKNNDNIKVYVGPLFKELIEDNNIENIFTEFPGEKIRKINIFVGTMSKDNIQEKLNEGDKIKDYDDPGQIEVYDGAQKLLNHPEFKISPEKKELKLIKLTVADLGFSDGAEYQEILARAEELGLKIAPAEVGPLLRIKYQEIMGHDQPKREYIYVPTNIRGSDGISQYFNVRRDGYGKRDLYCSWYYPDDHFSSDYSFLFARK
jgi:hypothetical protein